MADSHSTAAPAQVHWNLDPVVEQLRSSREVTHKIRHQGTIRELPSKTALVGILHGLCAVLFPTHYGRAGLTDESIDYFVGDTLNTTLSLLNEQVRRGLVFNAEASGLAGPELNERAVQITRNFASQLPSIRALLA